MDTQILALSGFLGLPHDWEFLKWKNLKAIDWQIFSLTSLPDWAMQFNDWVKQQQISHPKILMGYSLGGRLALHALIQQPQQWQGAIIISSHPGLSDPQARQQRLHCDQIWAERFANENWTTLIQAWNAQAVFATDSVSFERQESDYQRHHLVQAFIHGSLGLQEDLHHQIANLPIPILWLTGKQDSPYCQVARNLSFTHSSSCWKCIECAGHRAPWSQPQVFSQIVENFLKVII